MKELWEILVPYADNDGKTIDIREHRIWDAQVRQVSGGLTIMGLAKGQWLSPNGKLFIEKMIPVRIVCTKEQIKQIARMTICFYRQEAVLYYRISEEVYLDYADSPVYPDGYK